MSLGSPVVARIWVIVGMRHKVAAAQRREEERKFQERRGARAHHVHKGCAFSRHTHVDVERKHFLLLFVLFPLRRLGPFLEEAPLDPPIIGLVLRVVPE